ncbi:MAG TPA: matrixin family metalloprotease [Gemmataceae bacterium]|nr:matrixin family metalloprotease [Gemmataceae bacterium]
MTGFAQLVVEQLEDRLCPSDFGIPWPNPGHMTLSFVPDGTAGGTSASNLFQTLNGVAAPSTWELEIIRAFETWAVNSNINLTVVPDGGQPLGIAGAVQGDSRFGDIRIAAAPGGPSATSLANTQPFSWTGTTWSGDVVFNSSMPFSIGNAAGKYDLYSVALHEAGHVFGLDHDDADITSVMYPTYSFHTQLAGSDISELQALYGVRRAEPENNGTLGTATPLSMSLQGATVTGDIGSSSDVDYYKIQTPGWLTGFNGFTLQLQTANISLLTSNLAVYDGAGHLIASTSAVDPLHGNLSLTLNANPGSTYYLRVSSATGNVFGVGSYQLSVINRYWLISLGTVLNLATTVLNDTFATAQHLLSQNPGTDQRFDYFTQGNLITPNGGNYFVVQSPRIPNGNLQNMAAIVWGLDPNGLLPRIHVYDSNQNPIAVQVIANGSGTYTVQLANVPGNTSYYVEVVAANPGASRSTGRYALAVDFHVPQLVSFANLAAGTLTPTQSQTSGALTLTGDELFHFALSASSANPNAWVTMTVRDSSGAVVLLLKVQAGQPTVTADVFLKMGTYSVSFAGSTSDGSSWSGIDFTLAGDVISDPVGAYSTPPSSTGTSSPTSSGSSSTPPSYYSYTPAKPGPSSSSTTTPPYYY